MNFAPQTPYTDPMLRYAITNRTRFPGDEAAQQAALLEQAAHLAESGVDFVQLREKDLQPAALANLVRNLLAIFRTHPNPLRLLINDRADIAIATRADGVHLTSAPGSLTPTQIRNLYTAANLPTPIVSVSCHTLVEVTSAREDAATLILFGPIFEKRIGEKAISTGTGLDLLHAACTAAMPTPVLALGGITAANTPACLAAGAAGIAAIRLFQTNLPAAPARQAAI
jgi:thiamine-phosphate pyrophosphorylase